MATLPIQIVNSDFVDFTDLPGSIDFVARMETHILQAQRVDLNRFLGNRFYHEVVAGIAATTAKFITLRDGEDYDDDGITISYEGLKPIIVNYALARFYQHQDINITRRAIVKKVTEYSEPLTGAEKQGLILSAKSTAKTYEDDLLAYLRFRKEDFPVFFECDPDQRPQKKTAIRITASRGEARTIVDNDRYEDNYRRRRRGRGYY